MNELKRGFLGNDLIRMRSQNACEPVFQTQSGGLLDSLKKTRLNRAIAESGHCGRRKADELILAGRVRVNGEKIMNPATHVGQEDQIDVDGHPLQRSVKLAYVMMNKPPQVICSMRDPQGRPTVINLLPEKFKRLRLFPVGRLDYFSEGLLLLTNDGGLANALTHPSFSHEKLYEVLLRGQVLPSQLEMLRKGMLLENKIKLRPIDVEAFPMKGGGARLLMSLRQGINRQIRRICAQFGWTVLKLKRLAEASLELGELETGACRELNPKELAQLKELEKEGRARQKS